MTAPQDPFAAPGDQPPVPGQQPGYGVPPGYPPPYGAPQGYPPPCGQVPAPQGTNTLAIVGFILTFVVCPPVGAVLCYIALGQIKRTGEGGRGLALAGVWIGIIAVVLAVLIVLALFTFGAAVEGTFEETVVPLPPLARDLPQARSDQRHHEPETDTPEDTMTNPQDPFGAPGEQPPQMPPGYGAPPPAYGQVPPPPPYGTPGPQFAGWGARVQSALIDWFLPFVVADLVYYASNGLGVLMFVAAFAWMLYNRYLEGTTGQSTGKKMAGTRLVRAQDGQLVGAGLAIGRAFVHVVDGLPCYLGYLWPLWDKQRQTFADKILGTVVIKA